LEVQSVFVLDGLRQTPGPKSSQILNAWFAMTCLCKRSLAIDGGEAAGE